MRQIGQGCKGRDTTAPKPHLAFPEEAALLSCFVTVVAHVAWVLAEGSLDGSHP